MLRRVTDRLPHVPQVWYRRAHQLAYNTTVEFDGYEQRYGWIRQGIDVLLDGVEQNPESTDMVWMTARFIGWKIGTAHERQEFRRLFSEDVRLQERLARIIDLEQARSPDHRVDNWLVAQLLFEYCGERQSESPESFTIPSLLTVSRPAEAQARHAQALGEAGHWTAALQAWKQADATYHELDKRLDEVGTSDEEWRQLISLDYWLTRCRFEQQPEVQSLRKLTHEAAEHVRDLKTRAAFEAYGESLQAISGLAQKDPERFAVLASDYRYVAVGYRKAAQQLGESEDPALTTLLNFLEKAWPNHGNLMLKWDKAGQLISPPMEN